MRGRSGRHHSQAGGVLFAIVAALLIAPMLFVAALLNLAGPSTRAVLAGEDLARLDEPTTLFAPWTRERQDDGAVRPLSDGGAAAPADVAPIFEPRIGRFGLNDADPGVEDDEDHLGYE